MNEDERRAKGLLFSPADPELKAIKLRTHNLNIDYNKTYEQETEKRAKILSEIIGSLGEGSFLQGPIYFHYGIHTEIGRNFFANFNLTVQDDAEVTIGDNCNFGSGFLHLNQPIRDIGFLRGILKRRRPELQWVVDLKPLRPVRHHGIGHGVRITRYHTTVSQKRV